VPSAVIGALSGSCRAIALGEGGSAFSLLLPHYHVSTRMQVDIFNKPQKFSRARRFIPICVQDELKSFKGSKESNYSFVRFWHDRFGSHVPIPNNENWRINSK
jgi:hypothetical protein